MNSRSNLRKAKDALRDRFSGAKGDDDYATSIEENLIAGVKLEQFERDFQQGSGNELRSKFRAIYSSAALVANCFTPFKVAPDKLSILGTHGAESVCFEKRLKVVPGRNPANLDVWIKREGGIVAVESKLLEYFTPKKAVFAEAYDLLASRISEPCWLTVFGDARKGHQQHLDRAQLIKHYLALRQSEPKPRRQTLLYIFWELQNWRAVDECRRHRVEVAEFAAAVSPSEIEFRWMTYGQLWDDWSMDPALTSHAHRLKERYSVIL